MRASESRMSATAMDGRLATEPASSSAGFPLTVAADPIPEMIAGRTRAKPRRLRLARGRVISLVAADAAVISLAQTLGYVAAGAAAPPALLLLAIPVWIAVFMVYNLYERQNRSISPATSDELGDLFHALAAGSLLFLVASQLLEGLAGAEVYSPLQAALFMATALPLVLLARGCIRSWVFPAVMSPSRTLIVGAGEVGQIVARKLRSHPEYGLDLVGYVDEEAHDHAGPIVGRPTDLTRLVEELEIDWVILAFSRCSFDESLDMLRAARRPDVHLSIVPRFFEVFGSNATIQDLEGMPVVNLPQMRLSRSVRFVKRLMDVVFASLGLVVLSPLFAAVAIAIKLNSPGPVFFRQGRHGRGGTVFRIVKFRTMEDGAEGRRSALATENEVDGVLFKIKDDPRITSVGRFLRRTSIDELPQLWNVVRGEMSLVGPRPFVVHESNQITGWASRRLDLTPGVTGLWQVLGRNDLPFEEMVKLDYVYVTNWSFWWDLKLLLQTIPVVLSRRGAY
jgi:exopolysaccharide biosynthesis polyprenyl glycosylphosphotransferase